MSSYNFPILTHEDCIAFFKEISNAPLSEEDFKKPEVKKKKFNLFYLDVRDKLFMLLARRENVDQLFL